MVPYSALTVTRARGIYVIAYLPAHEARATVEARRHQSSQQPKV